VAGRLDLRHHKVSVAVEIQDCEFLDAVDLRYCEFEQAVDFTGSSENLMNGVQARAE